MKILNLTLAITLLSGGATLLPLEQAEAAPSCLAFVPFETTYQIKNNCNYRMRASYPSKYPESKDVVMDPGQSWFFIAPIGTPVSSCNMELNPNCKPTLAGSPSGSDTGSGSRMETGKASNRSTPQQQSSAQMKAKVGSSDGCVSRILNQFEQTYVVNNCGYTLRGNFRGDKGGWGQFGPVKPGDKAMIMVKKNENVRAVWCNEDAEKFCNPGKP